MTLTIYHNPRCSKSRQTLALLEEKGHEPTIVKYLENSPSVTALKKIIKALGVKPSDLLRRGEEPYKALGLKDASDALIIKAMVENPILIERPIVVNGDKARIGRPPESVLDIL